MAWRCNFSCLDQFCRNAIKCVLFHKMSIVCGSCLWLSVSHCIINQDKYSWLWLSHNTRVNQLKTVNMLYLVIYWTQNVHNDFIFLCNIVLPPVGHSSNHEYHCWNLQDNPAVVRIFIALLRFSFESPSCKSFIKLYPCIFFCISS